MLVTHDIDAFFFALSAQKKINIYLSKKPPTKVDLSTRNISLHLTGKTQHNYCHGKILQSAAQIVKRISFEKRNAWLDVTLKSSPVLRERIEVWKHSFQIYMDISVQFCM